MIDDPQQAGRLIAKSPAPKAMTAHYQALVELTDAFWMTTRVVVTLNRRM